MRHPYLAKLWFLLLFLGAGSLFSGAVYAQATGSVSGRITDDKREGVPGATVLVEGTTLGASTNVDGTYSIQNVPAGARTLIVSNVGFTTQRLPVTITAGQNTATSVSLAENTTQLSEAVVVGYGTQRRQDLTGAVEQITEKQFVKGQVTNPEQLIQGKVAGVQITTGGGAPGAGSEIRIRGGSSLAASNAPLIVIDGVPVDNTGIAGAGNPLTLINPNDIESISVLKDASSTAIYGVRASNGVIIVTTKKGVQGDQTRVSASTQFSLARPAGYVDVLSADEFRTLVNARGTGTQRASLGTANTDWQREIFRTGKTSDNNVSVSGSVGPLPYRASGGFLHQEGLLKQNTLKRYSGSLNLNPVLLDGKLRVNLNLRGSWLDNQFSNQGAVGSAVSYDPTQPIASTAGRFVPFGGYVEFLDPSGNGKLNSLAPLNPVGLINGRRDRSTVTRSIGNLQLDYKLPFLTGLSANLNLGYDIQRGRGTVFVPARAAQDFGQAGRNNRYAQDLDNALLEAYGKYERTLGPGRLDFLAGYSYQKFQNRSYIFNNNSADGKFFQQETPLTYSGDDNYLNTNVLLAFFSRANYNILDRYLFTGTLRLDGTSRFNPEPYGLFPSAAFAWRLKGEKFLADVTSVSDLKLRVGFGITGQQDLGGNFYPFLAGLTQSSNTAQYQLGNTFFRTLRSDQYSPDITWETTTTYNLGLDYGLFGGRFYGSVDLYQRDTKDLLNFRNIGPLEGLSNGGIFNTGSLTNKGVELIANVDVVKGEQLNVTVNANATYNRNRITALTGSESASDIGQPTGGIGGGVGNNIQINTVGFPSQAFFVNRQVYGADGKPLEGVYVDADKDNTISSADRYRYKSARPDYLLGGGANVTYRGASLAFTMRANLGNYVYNNLRSNSFYDASTNGLVFNRNREILTSGFSSAQYFSDYFIENASFLRMENITAGYNFGELIRKGSNLSVSFAVQNAFLITNYSGLDPEISNGIDNTIYPRPRTFTVGLNVGI